MSVLILGVTVWGLSSQVSLQQLACVGVGACAGMVSARVRTHAAHALPAATHRAVTGRRLAGSRHPLGPTNRPRGVLCAARSAAAGAECGAARGAPGSHRRSACIRVHERRPALPRVGGAGVALQLSPSMASCSRVAAPLIRKLQKCISNTRPKHSAAM